MKNIFCVCYVIVYVSHTHAKLVRSFPDGFSFGAAISAYQTEGFSGGRGETVWDRAIRNNGSVIKNNSNPDIACDSYHKYEEDVSLAARLGLTHYRFSIAWSRILPTGFPNEINYEAITYYSNLIREIKKYNMKPVATLSQFDLPQSLQDIGGWLNEDLVDIFVDYSRIVFNHLKGVEYWLTINEPRILCNWGYGDGLYAPFIKLDGIGNYKCAYIVIKAHSAVYRMFKKEFEDYPAKMSIVLDGEWSEPATNSTADQEAAERRNQFEFGLYANPIYNGNWPQIVIDRVRERSLHENFTKSRLPLFTEEEITEIKGTYDFIALNTYWTDLVADVEEPAFGMPSFHKDEKTKIFRDPSWEISVVGVQIVPWGTRKVLKWIKDTYNNPEIFITENGVADDGTLKDDVRIRFLSEYLNAVLDAMYEDDVKVVGYSAWSLLDNFEWTNGYTCKMGFYRVDFNDPNRTRTPKKSAEFYKKIATTLQIPPVTNFVSNVIEKR